MMDFMERSFKKMDRLASSKDRVPLDSVPGFANAAPPTCQSDAGRVRVVTPGDEAMARELGVNTGLLWAFQGDLDNIDIKTIRKTLTSGKDVVEGIVVKQELWPNKCLSIVAKAGLGPQAKVKFEKLTFPQFAEGWMRKILIDTPQSQMSKIATNKMRFFDYLVKCGYSLPWNQVLALAQTHLDAIEHDSADWEDWPKILEFLKQNYEQIRMSSSNSVPAFKASADGGGAGAGAGAGSGASSGAGREPKKKPFKDNADGVPSTYMISKGICASYNMKLCSQKEKQSHEIRGKKVNHWCGGCFKKSDEKKHEGHPAEGCKEGPFHHLFA